jgi:hypothetical protein
MKKYIFLSLVFLAPLIIFAQAKKPTIMIVPAITWMNEMGYTQKFENQGRSETFPDYEKAFLESSELKIVINKINEMMISRGFPTKLLESSLKSLKSESAEDAMLTSKNGGEVAESPIDKLKKTAKADIWMEIYWKVNTVGMGKKSISFTFTGLDAYTDKAVCAAGSTGPQTATAEVAVMLEEVVLMYIDKFNAQLQTHFEDMFANGREVILRIKKFDSFDGDLESEYDGEELGSLIENWVSNNTVKNRFNTSDATENFMLFEQVRIPLFNEQGKPTDARGWAKGLQAYLKTLGITSKLMTKGLGQAVIVVGDK